MIKSSLFFLVVAFLFDIRVEAQTPYGIHGGINRANLSVSHADGNEEFDTLTGMGFGGWADIRLGQSVDLRLEPMYLRKGAQHQLNTPDILNVYQYKIDYWELPAFLKLNLGRGITHPYLMTGMTIGFRLGARTAHNYYFNNRFNDSGLSTGLPIFKLFDLGISFGAGINFKLGHESIFIQSRYVLGLVNIRNDSKFTEGGVPWSWDGKVKTRGLQIIAGVPLSLFDF